MEAQYKDKLEVETTCRGFLEVAKVRQLPHAAVVTPRPVAPESVRAETVYETGACMQVANKRLVMCIFNDPGMSVQFRALFDTPGEWWAGWKALVHSLPPPISLLAGG